MAGDKFPPLTLFDVEGKRLLVDGAHRLEAAKRCGLKRIACIVRDGNRQDAVKYALGANRGHGLQRGNEDKRRCAEIALREFPELSDRAIAEMCGVSDRFVNKVRGRADANRSDLTRTGRDGKRYRIRRRTPLAKSRDDLPDFKLPRDLGQREHALSAYFAGLSERLCALITKHPSLASPARTAVYAMVGKVLKRVNEVSPTPRSPQPAAPVAAGANKPAQ